jgi:hypothetical protein
MDGDNQQINNNDAVEEDKNCGFYYFDNKALDFYSKDNEA